MKFFDGFYTMQVFAIVRRFVWWCQIVCVRFGNAIKHMTDTCFWYRQNTSTNLKLCSYSTLLCIHSTRLACRIYGNFSLFDRYNLYTESISGDWCKSNAEVHLTVYKRLKKSTTLIWVVWIVAHRQLTNSDKNTPEWICAENVVQTIFIQKFYSKFSNNSSELDFVAHPGISFETFVRIWIITVLTKFIVQDSLLQCISSVSTKKHAT